MSSRTYIGPFGRILPLPEGSEPEPLPRPLDEDRSGVQLPQPALNFGTDTQLGVTDPTKYNKSRVARTSQDTRFQYGEQPRHLARETLPPVRQLLTPGSQPSIPASPYSSQQHSPGLPQTQTSLASSRHGSIAEQNPDTFHGPHNAYRQPLNPGLGLSVPELSQTVNYNSSAHVQQPAAYLPAQQSGIAYGSYSQMPSQVPYQTQPPNVVPNLSMPQYPGYQSEPGAPINLPGQYHPGVPKIYNFPANSGPSSAQTQQSSPNAAKPAPRMLREDIIPGEGPVWVYEDGTTCPKVIDGEPVNAEWGITKAGKPRKRLAIACTSCRDKKIKCEPAEPKCVQCEKFGRDCKFTTA
ncbi:MAG: hypothetical protein Q9217_002263 [Psora testacea]